MAYTPKGFDASYPYHLYQVVVGTTKLNGISRFTFSAGAQHFVPQAIGSMLPKFMTLNFATGEQTFETAGIGQLITLGCGLDNAVLGTVGEVTTTLKAYWAKIAALGGLTNEGIKLTVPKGVLRIDQLSVQQDQLAVASARVTPIYDGTNALFSRDDVSDLAATCGAMPTEDEAWTMGAVTIDGKQIELATGWSFQNLPFRALRSNGSPYAKYGWIHGSAPQFRIQLAHPTAITDVGPLGISTTGTGVGGATFRLTRLDHDGGRRSATAGHILVTVPNGSVTSGDANGQAGEHMTSELIVTPLNDAESWADSVTFEITT